MIKLNTYSLRYGDNNLTDALTSGQIGFELEISTPTSIVRQILTKADFDALKVHIAAAEASYDEFKAKFSEQNGGIIIGAKVMLNSGGPIMEVVDIETSYYTCRWDDGDSTATQSFRKPTVKLVK